MKIFRYYSKRDAEDAMDALDGRQYDGRDLKISIDAGRPTRYTSPLFLLFQQYLDGLIYIVIFSRRF